MARDDTHSNADPAPKLPRLPLLALTGRVVGSAVVIGILSLLARETIRTHPPVSSAPVPSVTASVTRAELGIAFVPATMPAAPPAVPLAPNGRLRLGTGGDDGAGDPVRVEPVRRPETLARGDFSAIEATHLRLTLTRDAAEPAPSLFVTLARRAAEGMSLSVVRTAARGRIATKFGAVETLEITLAGPLRRVCTGFATVEARPVRIDGWLCAPLGRPPEPRALACTLDALTLDAPADPATNAVFAEAEHRRDPACDPIRALSGGEAEGRTGSIGARRRPARGKTVHD
ncbi:hypothetical protein [uncultured Methylobacterium sp.]|uniref:hypothetical protein n=1 Tax=uncultured Methylobacterium sp. TaxID=157278 RepID=UPI0035CA4D3D